MQSDKIVSSCFDEEVAMGRDNFLSAFEYIHEPREDDRHNSRRPTTVFEARMPGAMTTEEVEDQIDLDRWKLKLGRRLVELEVRLKLQTYAANETG